MKRPPRKNTKKKVKEIQLPVRFNPALMAYEPILPKKIDQEKKPTKEKKIKISWWLLFFLIVIVIFLSYIIITNIRL